jgi:hypothetical protein
MRRDLKLERKTEMKGFGNAAVVVVVIGENEKLKSLKEVIGYEKV